MGTHIKKKVIPRNFIRNSHPDGLWLLAIDESIRPLVKLINERQWIKTTCSCQGHPDSLELFTYSLHLLIEFVINDYDIYSAWKRRIDKEIVNNFPFFMGRDGISIRAYTRRTDNGWTPGTILYDYKTIGQRNLFVELLIKSFKEVKGR